MGFIERYFGKTSLRVSAKDIESLVKKKIKENSTLDYKEIAILDNPDKIYRLLGARAGFHVRIIS